jgi:hypothetical protein
MRLPLSGLLLSFGTILALQTQIQAQAIDQQSPVSINRIRAGLNRPPPLRIVVPSPLRIAVPSGDRPTFRSAVRARPFVLPSFVLPSNENAIDPTLGLPSLGELVMEGIENVRSAAVQYKRRRAERRARKEVHDFLAAFCAIRECPTPRVGK